ncbi:MAG: hypothetical protein FWC94_04730 [Bacteroidales bacterium]|nr:hypothetical protein [Bacteroidales bacterium]
MILALFLSSCNRGDGNPHQIPICTVHIDIYLDSFDRDLVPGRVKTFNNARGMAGCYGHRNGGVVVINLNGDDFLAWDMACPNDHWMGGVVIPFHSLAQAMPDYFHCSMCDTRFNPLDGQPMTGAATRFVMRQYSVTRVSDRLVRVYN